MHARRGRHFSVLMYVNAHQWASLVFTNSSTFYRTNYLKFLNIFSYNSSLY